MRFSFSILFLLATSLSAAQISIAPLSRTTPVNFETEILPFLKQSCLACHNQTKAKADLILETPQTILKGGESGPAVLPGKAHESLLLDVATHSKKPFMPPPDNKVNAPALTPDQLALLKLWIEQGASGDVHGAQAISWRPLSDKVRPILSLAVTDDGQFAAAGRGNEIVLYQLPTGRTIGPLIDPDLLLSSAASNGAAHLDLVESLDFSPDGELLASGSYREVKLWRRHYNHSPASAARPNSNSNSIPPIATSVEARLLAIAGDDGVVHLWNLDNQKLVRELKGDYPSSFRLAQLQRASTRSSNNLAYRKSTVEKSEKERQNQVDRVRKAGEVVGLAQKALAEQTNQVNTAKSDEAAAQKELAALQSRFKDAQTKAEQLQADAQKTKATVKDAPREALESRIDELVAQVATASAATNNLALLKVETEKNEKAAQEKIKTVLKRIADAEAALKRSQLTNSAADNELHFAITAAQTSFDDLTLAQNNLQLAESDRKQLDLQLESAQNAVTNSINRIRALAFSADGKILAAASEKGPVTVWSASTGEPLETLALPYVATALSFQNSDTLITSTADQAEGWSISPTWKLERVITSANAQPAFADRINAVRFSPDNQFLATGGGEPSRSGEVKIWRARDGHFLQELKSLHSDTVLSLAFSPDGRYLASGAADRFAKITELATGKTLRVLEGHTHHVLALTWKSDGHTLVTAGADNLVKIWDAFSADKKKGPDPLSKEATAITYVGETDQLLVSCGDGTLRLIKENGENIRSFEGASSYLQAAVATPNQRLVLAGGHDGVLRVWQTDSAKLAAEFR
jgi:WD40 repeat protein